MELLPRHPPGRANRKLRGYLPSIAALRVQGYTIKAIHQALCDKGIDVSWITVQREVARLEKPSGIVIQRNQKQDTPNTPTPTLGSVAAASFVVEPGNSKVDVDEFFRTHNPNPLFNKKANKP